MRLYGAISDTNFGKRRTASEIFEGTTNPEGSQTGDPGDLYVDRSATSDVFLKETGTGNTGWVSLKDASDQTVKQTINNNQSSALDIGALLFDSTSYKAARVLIDLFRRTDSTTLVETGELFFSYDSEASDWDVKLSSHFDDAGVSFSVTSGGQAQYVSTNMAGASYAGNIRMGEITRIPVSAGDNQFTVPDNQTSPLTLTGLLFDSDEVRAGRLFFDIFRRTDSIVLLETGELFFSYDSEASDWRIDLKSHFDDAGVVFTMTSGGQIQLTSSDLAGANYAGTLRIGDTRKVKP